MKQNALSKVQKEVVKQFPEMEGTKPSVKSQQSQYLLTFRGKAELPGGKKMSRIVRVVADEDGRVLKISTSR